MALVPVFQQARHHPVRHAAHVHLDADLPVRDRAEVIYPVLVPRRKSAPDPGPVPQVPDGTAHPSVQQPPEPAAAVAAQLRERRVRGGPDGNVVRMPGESVRAEGGNDVGAVRRPAVRGPRRVGLPAADPTERFTDRRVGRIDLPGAAVGRMDQDKAEFRFVFVQRHRSGQPVRIIIRMRDNQGKHVRARHVRHLLRLWSPATVPA